MLDSIKDCQCSWYTIVSYKRQGPEFNQLFRVDKNVYITHFIY